MQRVLIAFLTIALSLSISFGLHAQNYPTRPIRIIVPFAPGGAVDVVARKMGQYLSVQFKQTVIIENKPGASGNIGAEAVQQSAADGYTFLVSASTFVVNPVVSADKPNFDPLMDFSYLGLIAKGPLLFIVHTGIANNLQEFVATARAHPEKINFATGGYGSAGHMAAESFKLRAGLNVPVVLYKGTGPAFSDLIGGHISGIMDPMLTSLPLAKGGKATALALAGPSRSPLAPDVPTFAEVGFPGFEFYTWYGLWGPANLPKPVVSEIEQALKVVGLSAEAKKWFEQQGLVYSGISGPQFEQFARDEQALYAEIVKKAKLAPH